MNTFRYRPKDNYIQKADWQKLYILTEHWKTDISFYTDDLRFLHHLIDKYFLWISKKENIDVIQEIELNLLKVDRQSESLLNRVNKQLQYLTDLMGDPLVYNSDEFRKEHEQLEDDLNQFVIDFRENRKEIFKITEHIIKGEELIKQFNISSKPQLQS
ncbi:hypothetical protein H7F37_13690 [Winogradskyella sp. PAMC22761]|nr:hypothetical protein H7F37_13690 [Winogradskyella sp. PAMC22761]